MSTVANKPSPTPFLLDPHDIDGKIWNAGNMEAAVTQAQSATSTSALADISSAAQSAQQLLEQNGSEYNIVSHTQDLTVAAAAYQDMQTDANLVTAEMNDAVVRLQSLHNAPNSGISDAVFLSLQAELDAVEAHSQAQSTSYGQAAGAAAAGSGPVTPTTPITPTTPVTPTGPLTQGTTQVGQPFSDGYNKYDPAYQHFVTYTTQAGKATDFSNATAAMTPLFDDNFVKNGKQLLDPSKGLWNVANETAATAFHGGNGELEKYTSSQVTLDPNNGVVLTADKNTGPDSAASPYVSGKIFAGANHQGISSGAIEFTAKMPKGKGLWPAVWLLPTGKNGAGGPQNPNPDPNWPLSSPDPSQVGSELDVAEGEGGLTSEVHGTAHVGGAPDQDTAIGGVFNNGSVDYADGKSHTFALSWNKQGMQWYVDGQLYKSVIYNNLPEPQRTQAIESFGSGVKYSPIINLAVGGAFDQSATTAQEVATGGAKFPASLSVSDVQAWQTKS